MPSYRGIIFDLFGTLVDAYSSSEHRSVLSEMAAVLAVAAHDFITLWVDTTDERQVGAFPTIEANLAEICRALGASVKKEQIAAASRIRSVFTQRILVPRPDAQATLRQLKGRGHKIGLVSNCSPEVPSLWKKTALARLIDSPIFSCLVGLRKPDARIYEKACLGMGLSSESCLYIGDGSSHELTGALQVGMQAVLIRAPYEQEGTVERPDAELAWRGRCVSALSELPKLLDLA